MPLAMQFGHRMQHAFMILYDLAKVKTCAKITFSRDTGCRRFMITVPELTAEALGSVLASDMNRRFGFSHAQLTALVPSAPRLALGM